MVGREEEAACSTASRQRRGTKSRKGRGGVKTRPVNDGIGRFQDCPVRKGEGTYTRRPNHPFRRARVLEAVVECTGALCLGVLLIPRDRLIFVINGTWVSFPRPYKDIPSIRNQYPQIREGVNRNSPSDEAGTSRSSSRSE